MPPSLECNPPQPITASEGAADVSTIGYAQTDALGTTLVANPPTVSVNYADIGANPIITYTSTDLSNNTAICSSQMSIVGK